MDAISKLGVKRMFIFFLFQLLLLMNLRAGANYPPISYLGIENGLSNNSVRCIYQDHNGFMWFGTYDGLNRYDGYEFKVFRNKINDTASLPHNYINAICEDLRNNIWIGTGQGMSIYNNLTLKFLTGFYIPFGSTQKERIPFNINAIKRDKKGNLFIATNGGGLLWKPADSDDAIQLPCVKDEKGICKNDIQSIVIDNRQRIWLCVADAGIFFYNSETKKLQSVNSRFKAVRCMEADDEDNLWLSSYDGLYKYDIASGSFARPYDEQPGKLSSNVVVSLVFDRQRQLWMGTEGGGIDILNLATQKFTYLLPGEGKNTLSSESVFAIYEDKQSRKWIGTIKGGINIIDPQKSGFQTIAHDPLNPNTLINNFVSAFYEDPNQNLWIGTDGGGISRWDRRQNHFTSYQHIQGSNQSLSHNSVPSIIKDHLGDMWIATFGGGIDKFNKASGTFEHYRCFNEQTGEENLYVWLLYEDREENLWATTYANGRLYRFNRQANRFEVFCPQFADLFALMEDRKGTLWAGTAFGLAKVDKQNKTYTGYPIDKPVRAILEDKSGRLWVGTEGRGLILFDPVKGKIVQRLTTDDGLCNNSVLNILEDDKGNLWLSTFGGLSQFSPANKKFRNYYQEDGLQSNQFLFNAARRLRSGELVFGGIKGFSIFNPGKLQSRNYNPPVVVTGLRINNSEVSKGSAYITAVSDDKITSVKIPFSEAVLSIDFAALDYSVPGKIAYAYYLEGWDKGWNFSANVRTATYTRLNEGNYKLHIRATNAEGSWNPHEVSLKIVVLPPWYRSWWAYALYILIGAGAIVVYQRYRVNQARLAYDIKLARLNAQKERAERETEKVLNEKEKEINDKRLTFFTNISHEFRTPLTLVINPLKDILRKTAKANPADTNELNIVYRNARRMLSLVDQLLLFRKADTGAGQLKIVKLNFCRLCREVFLAFAQEAKAHNIAYDFDCKNEQLEIYGDREKIEIILYNLISNALKYTPPGGKVTVAITETENNAEVTVADSGYGIPKQVGDRLFERFYQVQEKGIPGKPGFGIGLYLVKNFVESHEGKIFYESETGKGTTFFTRFKKGHAHFGAQAIFEEEPEETILSEELIETNPVAAKQPPRAPKGEVSELITDEQSVLIVDDDEQMLVYLNQVFAGKYQVYQAENGEEGVHLAYQYHPDIIISDVKMPGISGIDFCRTVKEDPSLSHIPVILLTGESSLEKKLQGMEGGADDYITKPFEKDLLAAKVVNLLKSRSNLQNYFYNEITLQENPLKISEEYKAFLEKCIAVVEKHLDDENFNVKALAAELNMSHSNLYKKVKSISGQSVNAFIRFIRLRKAAEILINTNANVNETASDVGFSNTKYFREQFSKLFKMNPSEYSKKYRKAFGKSFNLNKDGLGGEE